MKIKYSFYSPIIVLLLSLLACSTPTSTKYSFGGRAFGTTYSIQYYSPQLLDLQPGVDSLIALVNSSVSTYQDDSIISRINKGDSTVLVDPIFSTVFELSREVHRNSSGYFDPTIGVLRNAYGFGDDAPLEVIDSTRLDSMMRFVGFEKVSLQSNGTVQKEHPFIYIDFNAVAKGYGIDLIGEFLSDKGLENYLVELGGEIVARGINLDKEKSWAVGIERVDSPRENRQLQASLTLSDMAMASSGNYRKYRVDSLTGKKYVHTIDPITGLALQGDVTSATIVASDCATADAYATACMAMGLERSVRMLEGLDGIEAYLTYEENGETKVFLTDGMVGLLLD